MASIKVDYQELETKCGDMQTAAKQMREIVNDIQTQITSLNVDWESDASENMITQMKNMTPIFERFEEIIISYGQFLHEASSIYSSTEEAINKEANNLEFH